VAPILVVVPGTAVVTGISIRQQLFQLMQLQLVLSPPLSLPSKLAKANCACHVREPRASPVMNSVFWGGLPGSLSMAVVTVISIKQQLLQLMQLQLALPRPLSLPSKSAKANCACHVRGRVFKKNDQLADIYRAEVCQCQESGK
jgi:hypothetical protein